MSETTPISSIPIMGGAPAPAGQSLPAPLLPEPVPPATVNVIELPWPAMFRLSGAWAGYLLADLVVNRRYSNWMN